MVQAQSSPANVDTIIYNIVEKVAEQEAVDPIELTPPLFEVIDPDALGQIFATTPTAGRMEVQVTFSYNGYQVAVRGDGSVSVEG
ncbi:HalOD1 output domain-containing protein [Halorubrum sp. AD140]|uniref:HalOD1 output domain-containing protein n=1 Tax=Halorubrum sp. AD140 TaxID=3050073 RepID=UPI002ACC66E8|nr:HalOD1 output domain-containing protein [Halorubrum sp. AD140]MDZ5810297.1 HalOD1 output domain-containing protein [Halorubrum sp. AD140]